MKLAILAFLLSILIVISTTPSRTELPNVVPEGYVAYSFSLRNNMGSIELFVPENMSHFRTEIDLSDSPPDDAYTYTFTDTTYGSYKGRGFFDNYIGEYICHLEFRHVCARKPNQTLLHNENSYSYEEKLEYVSRSIYPCPLYLEFDTMHVDGHVIRFNEQMLFDTAQFPDELLFSWSGYTTINNQILEITLDVCGPENTTLMEKGIQAIRSIRFHPHTENEKLKQNENE